MEDPEVVAAIVAGDPAGLAEAYDRYATPLYSYCRALLHEPADAADAVQDTFLVAAAKLRDLRDPARLRPWLYAVARNECFRRLRAGKALSALDEAADLPAASAEPGAATEQAELGQLVRAAMEGLNPGERDVLELHLVAELDGDELAAALGVSRNHAHALLSRARSQLERSLGALIVARTGREACAGLDSMLTGWDGRLTVLLRKRISRHIDDCDICGERKRRELTPAMFAGAVPVAAIPALLSPGFREQVLQVLADRSPAGIARRLSVANRAGPFGPKGFPTAASPPGAAPWRRVRPRPQAAVAVAAVVVIVAGAVVAGILAGSHHRPPAGAAGGQAPGASASAGTPARGGPSGSHAGGGNGSNGRNGASGGHGPVPAAAANGGTATPVSVSSSSPASGAPTPVAASSSPAAAATGTGTAPASSPSATARTSAPAPAAGTLSLSTGTLRLVSVKGVATAKFTVTAKGGPVSYSITPGSSLAGSMTVSPSAGSLAAGASVTVTVTSTSLVAVDGTLTVNPGGQTIAVVLSVSL